MYVSLRQSSSKEPPITFAGPLFEKQRKQAAKIYEFVFKPLFEKKDLKKYYLKLVGLSSWLVFMDGRMELITDLAKKINIFLLYHKTKDSLEMITVCNLVFDWLSIHFPR